MKIIIAGSRHLTVTPEKILELLEKFKIFPSTIISGGAKGIDKCGEEFSELVLEKAPLIFEAKWDDLTDPNAKIRTDKHGRKYNAKAGPDRNKRMADIADALLLIWEGKSYGSLNMKREMQRLKKPVFEEIIVDEFFPEDDGITHINIYSKGKTEIGRWLSNFAYAPIVTEDGPFNSIEGYWYWLSCRDESLRDLSGFKAKFQGRASRGKDWVEDPEFKAKITEAITIKLETYSDKYEEFRKTNLPLTHYYYFDNKKVNVTNADWILKHLECLRRIK